MKCCQFTGQLIPKNISQWIKCMQFLVCAAILWENCRTLNQCIHRWSNTNCCGGVCHPQSVSPEGVSLWISLQALENTWCQVMHDPKIDFSWMGQSAEVQVASQVMFFYRQHVDIVLHHQGSIIRSGTALYKNSCKCSQSSLEQMAKQCSPCWMSGLTVSTDYWNGSLTG